VSDRGGGLADILLGRGDGFDILRRSPFYD
jgi:hypothetical protein